MSRMANLFVVIVVLFFSRVGVAGWVGPEVVLSGSWGGEEDQFGINEGDSGTTYSAATDVSSEGLIVVSDEINGRIKVYDSDGTRIENITPPVEAPTDWSMDPRFVDSSIYLPLFNSYFFSSSGEMLVEFETPDGMSFWGERNNNLYLFSAEPAERWLAYSPTGDLLNTYTEKPLELGRIKDEVFLYQEQLLHRVTISFSNDRQWVISSEYGPCGEYDYQLDNAGNLYCVGQQAMERYSACGKVVSELALPEPQWETVASFPDNPGIDPISQLVEEYRGLVLGDDGSAYSSRATQSNYAVAKWVWQDSPDDPIGGPDAPVDLDAVAGESEVKLSWTHSLQDPGCVTRYEIGRATTAGGPYTVLTTVEAGPQPLEYEPYTHADSTAQAGTTYYYAVRAVSAIGKSGYSNEASTGL